jgi:peptidyl-tRNA hydrolase
MLVRDAGRTVVQAGTPTCVGIGPDLAERIDPITGALPLVR